MAQEPEHKPAWTATRAQREMVLLAADAIMRNVDAANWRYVVALARSILRTATDALAVEQGVPHV